MYMLKKKTRYWTKADKIMGQKEAVSAFSLKGLRSLFFIVQAPSPK
jgi:hypothetical protein